MPTELDCKGLRCPLPIVRLGAAMRKLDAGAQLLVEATDPAFQPDLYAWARKTQHKILSFEGGPVQRALLEKSPTP